MTRLADAYLVVGVLNNVEHPIIYEHWVITGGEVPDIIARCGQLHHDQDEECAVMEGWVLVRAS